MNKDQARKIFKEKRKELSDAERAKADDLMIELKTSVLLAASLKLGSILGGASQRNQNLLYEFGKKLGIAFQIQDDYLDAFGDPKKFGKQPGGDIKANKKTFLLIQALATANDAQKKELKKLMTGNGKDKTEKVLQLFHVVKRKRSNSSYHRRTG